MNRNILAAALLACSLACTGPSYSPETYKAALAVKVFQSPKDAEGIKYTVIQEVKGYQGYRGPLGVRNPLSPDAAISAAKMIAASLGANGLIVLEVKETGLTWKSNNDMECRALAVKIH